MYYLSWIRKKVSIIIILSVIAGLSFAYGFLCGAFKLPPHDQIRGLKKFIISDNSTLNHWFKKEIIGDENDRHLYVEPDAELLTNNFVDPLINNVPQLFPPIKKIDDLVKQFSAMGLRSVPFSAYYDAYDSLEIGNIKPGHHNDVIKMDVNLRDNFLTAYAYKLPKKSKSEVDCAILYMPGTGHNASTDILTSNPVFYRDSAQLAARYCDVYIYVRPLEDFRSIHNDYRKIRENFMYGDAVVNGSNHSTVYMIEALGLAKALRRDYEYYGIIGLSLGGHASLILSLDASPDFAVIASGWSVVYWQFTTASISQLLIPGLIKHYNEEKVRNLFKKQSTRYLFTYGRGETANYGFEAQSGQTCAWLANIDAQRLKCGTHAGGHRFGNEMTENFISQVLSDLRTE